MQQAIPAARVIEVDPDTNLDAIHVAIVGAGAVTQTYARFSTGEGNHLGSGYGIDRASPIDVPCMTITGLMKVVGIGFWDVVKLDCEGAEFGILENWPGRIARQISVEFHDAFDPAKWNDQYFEWLFSRLARFGYRVVSHRGYKLDQSQQSTFGHWDSLIEGTF